MSLAFFVAPSGAEQQRPLQSRIGEVEDGEQVDVVTAGDPCRRRPGPYGKAVAKMSARDEVGSDVGERLERRFQVLAGSVTRSSPASLTNRVAVSLNCPSFSSAVVRLGRSLISTSNAGGMSLSARSITSRCPANVPATRFSCWMEAMMLSRCCVEDADEIVEPGEQLADLGFASGQRGVEVVDDVADLSQPARVDDRRQRRQRLFGGRIGRRLVQAEWWHRVAVGRLAFRRAAG